MMCTPGQRLAGLSALALLLLMAVASGGCATTIVPPALEPHENAATIYLTDYGRHTGIILPLDHEDRIFVEYEYGDWTWFAQGRKGPVEAVAALFLPSAGALGRRYCSPPPLETADDTAAYSVYALVVRRADAEALIETLDARYESAIETEIYNAAEDLQFVRDDSAYWLFGNCNPKLATWLRELDCEIHGLAVFSVWRIDEPAAIQVESGE